MIIFYKKVFLIIIFTAVLLLSGCTSNEITCTADELKAYTWSASDDYGKSARLAFDEDDAEFVLKSGDTQTTIKGKAAVNDKSITISAPDVPDAYTFAYTLFGNKIEITYGGNTITLDKENND